MSSPTEEEVAYHEAGHAVMAYLIGKRIKKITIIPSDSLLGQVEHSGFSKKSEELESTDYWNYSMRKLVDGDVMLHYAGQIAQAYYSGKSPEAGSYSDDQKAAHMAINVTGSAEELDAYLYWLYVRTQKLICSEMNWPLIEAVAKELMSVKKMSGRRARKIIQEAHNAYVSSFYKSHTQKMSTQIDEGFEVNNIFC